MSIVFHKVYTNNYNLIESKIRDCFRKSENEKGRDCVFDLCFVNVPSHANQPFELNRINKREREANIE